MGQPFGFHETRVFTVSAGQRAVLSSSWTEIGGFYYGIGPLVGYRRAVAVTSNNSLNTGLSYGNEWTGIDGNGNFIANMDVVNTTEGTVSFQAPTLAVPYFQGSTNGVNFVESANIFTVSPGHQPLLISASIPDVFLLGNWYRAAVSLAGTYYGYEGVTGGGVSYGNEWSGIGLDGNIVVNIDVANTSQAIISFQTNYVTAPGTAGTNNSPGPSTVVQIGTYVQSKFTINPGASVILSTPRIPEGRWYRYGIYLNEENGLNTGVSYGNEWTGFSVDGVHLINIDVKNTSDVIVSFGSVIIEAPVP